MPAVSWASDRYFRLSAIGDGSLLTGSSEDSEHAV